MLLEIFDSFGDFAVFYITISVIIALGIIFHDELCALEDKYDEYIAAKKQERRSKKRTAAKANNTKSKTQGNKASVKRDKHFAA